MKEHLTRLPLCRAYIEFVALIARRRINEDRILIFEDRCVCGFIEMGHNRSLPPGTENRIPAELDLSSDDLRGYHR